MALSPQYGWAEPDNSSLVKNGAADIRTLGDAIDTSVWNVGFGQAGKNKIINGDFAIWQRGTSFSTSGAYNADRFIATSDATFTVSRQTFTAGAAPVAGYEGQYFLQFAKNAGGSYFQLATRLEDVRTFAGQTVTLSAWMKVSSGTASVEPLAQQDFGSGGSGQVNTFATPQTINTTWTRYSFTIAVPSVSGKTIGTSSFLQVYAPRITSGATGAVTAQIWGLQLEAGSVATAFQTATGTIQGELAACQRYYFRSGASNGVTTSAYNLHAQGYQESTTSASICFKLPITMRVAPTAIEYSGVDIYDSTNRSLSALTINSAYNNTNSPELVATASGMSQYRPCFLVNWNNTGGYVALTAEL
jgi:hypothetical protein